MHFLHSAAWMKWRLYKEKWHCWHWAVCQTTDNLALIDVRNPGEDSGLTLSSLPASCQWFQKNFQALVVFVGWSATEPSCPKRLWRLHLQRYAKSYFTWSCAAWPWFILLHHIKQWEMSSVIFLIAKYEKRRVHKSDNAVGNKNAQQDIHSKIKEEQTSFHWMIFSAKSQAPWNNIWFICLSKLTKFLHLPQVRAWCCPLQTVSCRKHEGPWYMTTFVWTGKVNEQPKLFYSPAV